MSDSRNLSFDAEKDFSAAPTVRLRVQTSLRWMAIIGQLAAVALVYFGFGFDLPLAACVLAIGLAVALNVSLLVMFPSNHMLTPKPNGCFSGL